MYVPQPAKTRRQLRVALIRCGLAAVVCAVMPTRVFAQEPCSPARHAVDWEGDETMQTVMDALSSANQTEKAARQEESPAEKVRLQQNLRDHLVTAEQGLRLILNRAARRCDVPLQFMLAETLERRGKRAEALGLYRELEGATISGTNRHAASTWRTNVAQAKAKVKDWRIAWAVTARLGGNEPPTPIALYVNDKPMRTAPAGSRSVTLEDAPSHPLRPPATVTLRAEAPGFVAATDTVTLDKEGALFELVLEVDPLAPQPFETDSGQADELERFASGLAHARKNEWEAAHEVFLSLAETKHPHVLFNAGAAAAAQHRYGEALAWYRLAAAAADSTSIFVSERARYRANRLQTAYGDVTLHVPSAASVCVNKQAASMLHPIAERVLAVGVKTGTPLGEGSYKVSLRAGRHQVRLIKPCLTQLTLDVEPGSRSVYELRCAAPVTPPNEPPTTALDPLPPRIEHTGWPLPRVLVVAAGAAAVAAGGTMLVMSGVDYDKALDACADRQCAEQDMHIVESGRNWGNWGSGLLVGGIALGTFGAFFYPRSERTVPRLPLRLQPPSAPAPVAIDVVASCDQPSP